MADTAYGDIAPRTAAFAAKELLERATPYMVIEKFGQARPLGKNQSDTIKFRKYTSLSVATTPLTEGVTPTAKQLNSTDVTARLQQYGDLVTITDKVMDTHEDPILTETSGILGEQAAETLETLRFNIIKGGTNVVYANGSARTDVNTVVSLDDIRQAVRTLKGNNAKPITSVVKSTPSYGTEQIAPAYIALCHPNTEADIRALAGFVPTEKYGTLSPYPSEIGKVEGVRFITSTVFTAWTDVGATGGTSVVETTSSKADIYPTIVVGRDAFGLVPLKGENSVTPAVVNPKPSDSDPMAQRGHVSWKTYNATVILNDSYMVRIESAISDLTD
jgi:N4-gp56 family major capsid protein